MMSEAFVGEFPFVADMPKRERSKVLDLWARFKEFAESCDEVGGAVPVMLAAKMLGISHQRVWELMKSGRLVQLSFEGHSFVSGDSMHRFAQSERKAGRPCKIDRHAVTAKGAWEAAKEIVK